MNLNQITSTTTIFCILIRLEKISYKEHTKQTHPSINSLCNNLFTYTKIITNQSSFCYENVSDQQHNKTHTRFTNLNCSVHSELHFYTVVT